ncbi:hypothetical protein BGZ96_009226 [Linnemannia gamsii]|uniref:Uncharacterized protein n=1 Tax=Linnemannia gamsii TaxID=64522 RepID=A0ABQ7KDD5_9FUNG|nr:hypothetical protein BGZ96_009226 [Linnemannia gamsii]
MTQADFEDASTPFQALRVPGEKVNILIPAVRHPTQGDLYVIWSDITYCFPETTRIQHSNVYVPMLRDARLYRVKPFGIKYHPGIVLDVIFGKKLAGRKNKSSNNKNQSTSSKTKYHSGFTSVEEAPVQGADHTTGREKVKGDEGDYVRVRLAGAPEGQEDSAVGLDTIQHKSTEQPTGYPTKQVAHTALSDSYPVSNNEETVEEKEEEAEKEQNQEKDQEQVWGQEQEQRKEEANSEENVLEKKETPPLL